MKHPTVPKLQALVLTHPGSCCLGPIWPGQSHHPSNTHRSSVSVSLHKWANTQISASLRENSASPAVSLAEPRATLSCSWPHLHQRSGASCAGIGGAGIFPRVCYGSGSGNPHASFLSLFFLSLSHVFLLYLQRNSAQLSALCATICITALFLPDAITWVPSTS